MAVDVERLIVQMSADFKGFEREMQKMRGVSARQSKAIEKDFLAMNKRLDGIGRGAAQSLIAPLTGIAGALTVNEVARYASAWTKARNELTSARVPASQQADTLQRLYGQAQAYSVELNAQVGLYASVARSAKGLTDEQEDLFKFTDAVAASLKVDGKAASEASGSLVQLGQVLRGSTVQAEEYNSLLDGMPALLEAAASGIKRFNGDVGSLTRAVKDGEVSSREFFRGVIAGANTLQSRLGGSLDTVEGAWTRVRNAAVVYIGSQDQALGATGMLSKGLNALADDFDKTADTALQVAAIIAGALVGRSIGQMIRSLGEAGAVVLRFVAAARAAATVGGVATAIGGLGAAAGPIGAILGAAAVATIYFTSSTGPASEGAKRFEARLEAIRKAAADANRELRRGEGRSDQQSAGNKAQAEVKAATQSLEEARAAAVKLFSEIIDNAPRRLISTEQLDSLKGLRDELASGERRANDVREELYRLANQDARLQRLADQMKPLLDRLAEIAQGARDASAEMTALGVGITPSERAGLRNAETQKADRQFLEDQRKLNARNKQQRDEQKAYDELKKTAGANVSEAALRQAAKEKVAADERVAKEGQKTPKIAATSQSRLAQDLQDIRDRAAALRDERAALNENEIAQEARRISLQQQQRTLAEMQEEARRNGKTGKGIPSKLDAGTIQDIDAAALEEAQAQADLSYGRELVALRDRTQAVRDEIEVMRLDIAAGRERALVLEEQAREGKRDRQVTDEKREAIRQLAQAEADRAYQQQARDADDRILDMQTEIDVLRLGILAKREDIIVTRELARARREGTLNDKTEPEIRARAAREASTAKELEGLQSQAELWNGIETSVASAGAAFVTNMRDASEIGRRLLQSIIEMVIQSALVGRNLSGGGGSGTLLTSAFKAVSSLFSGGTTNLVPTARAGGGPVSAGEPYIVGEKRPELFVPNVSGRIVPRIPTIRAPVAARQRVDNHFHITHDLRGANGDDAVRRIARQEGEASASRMAAIIDKQFAGRYQQMEADGW